MIGSVLTKVRYLFHSQGIRHCASKGKIGLGLGLPLVQVLQKQRLGIGPALCDDAYKLKDIRYFDILRSNLPVSKKVIQKIIEICQRHYLRSVMELIHSSTMFLHFVKQCVLKVPLTLKHHSVNIVRVCTQQCECVMAYRVRRSQQMFSLYSKMWDEMALKEFVRTLQRQFLRRGKVFLLSAAGLSTVNWDWENERISEDEILGHLDEIDYIHMLLKSTMTCHICQLRQIVNAAVPSVTYCQCLASKPPCKKSVNNWLPFIEGEDLLVWRKEEKHGLYCYKVYGSYNDVSAEDFLHVQLDINGRKEWDPTAVQLHVIDSDPNTNSDVVYWELEWPRLFANRDYVFNRRYIVDQERKIMLIVNQGTSHPSCPERPENHRVVDYWSFMVIRPYTEFDQPGLEFGLTYFDNPGINIPSAVTAWVAMSGLPQFLLHLRQAAREIGLKRQSAEVSESEDEEEFEITNNESSANPPSPTDNIPLCQDPQGKQQGAGAGDTQYFQQFHFRKLFL